MYAFKASILIWFLWLVSFTFPDSTAAQNRVMLGYSSLSSNQTPIWVAREEGYYKRFGVDADLILIEGSTRGAQALISGDLPVIGMAGQGGVSAGAPGGGFLFS